MIDLVNSQQPPAPAVPDDLGAGRPDDWALWVAETGPARQPWLLITGVVLLLVVLGVGSGLLVLRTVEPGSVEIRTGRAGSTHLVLHR